MMIRFMFLLIYLVPGRWTNRPPPITYNKYPIKIITNCTRETLQLKIDLGKPFKGIVFAKEFSEECRTRGNYSTSVELSLPTMGCGVRSEPKADGLIEISVKLVIQMDGKLRQSADSIKYAKCILPTEMMSMTIVDRNGDEKKSNRNGRMKFPTSTPLPKTPHVRVWLELGGENGAGAVEVGQPTTLGVRALLPNYIGVRVVDCAALDGLGEASQKLLDERGCPLDEQVMPSLIKRIRPMETSNSKIDDDDLVEKLFSATFPAFKFPDRERLHVSCGVQLCHGKCPHVNCKNDEAFILLTEKHLARIEVFNSLSVTAPLIELDNFQSEKKFNVSGNVDEVQGTLARRVKSEGTLCLSLTKLAVAFCILGFIFLLAVIIAVCCLLKSRSRDRNYGTYGTSIFSSTSSSSQSPPQSRFGSKLLIPYQGATLPYGRVY